MTVEEKNEITIKLKGCGLCKWLKSHDKCRYPLIPGATREIHPQVSDARAYCQGIFWKMG